MSAVVVHVVPVPPAPDGAADARGADADRALLSADELARADRFVFDRDSRLFVTAHAALRRILGAAVGVAPERLAFELEEHGRPRLAGGGPSFSLSHSGDRALVALGDVDRGDGGGAQRIGVDVERFRDGIDVERFAARNFTPFERAELAALHGAERLRGFFRVWTRKEAYIKALGKGLHHPLQSFDVTTGADARFAALRDGEPHGEWSLFDLDLGQRRAGALAVHPRCASVRIERGSPLEP